VAAVLGLVVYVIARQTFGESPGGLRSPESGLGFDDASGAQIRAIFQHAPWLFWSHNVTLSALTVLASEPRAGKWKFIHALLLGQAEPWQWLHVGSSLLTSAVVFATLIWVRVLTSGDRLLAAIGWVLVIGGSAFGFLYTRDRIALPAVVGYAILVYVAIAVMGNWARTLQRRAMVAALVALLAIAWTVRTAESGLQLRDRARQFYDEWTVRYDGLGGPEREQTLLTVRLRRDVESRVPADPRYDPRWTYRWFEREYVPADRKP
jgi:hypothetical protein